MKPSLLLVCYSAVLLAGCSAFQAPSASRDRRNEQDARNAESRRAESDRQEAIDHRAAAYERQGMSREDALNAARAESTAPRPR